MGQSPVKKTFRKFRRNFLGVSGLFFILICGSIAVFAYSLASDNTRNANQMHLPIHSQRPGFKVTMLILPAAQIQTSQNWWDQFFFGSQASQQELPIASYRVEEDGIHYFDYQPDQDNGLEKVAGWDIFPSHLKREEIIDCAIQVKTFLLGTDKYGRDLLSRLLVGSRISFFIGFVAVAISLLIGVFLGSIAGYYGGRVDAFVMWLINVTWSIPTLLLVIAITLALGKGYWQVFVAVGLTMWVEVARVTRGQVISAKEMQYVTAAKALGLGHTRIIFKHILPNIIAPLIVISAANFAAAILVESGLSFLGIGAQPPTPSWGSMIKDHYNYIILGKAYLAILPGLAIMSLVMAFMLVGNALRDALDVKA